MNRTALGLALSAFVVVGFVFWAAGMPKPAGATLSTAVLAAQPAPEPAVLPEPGSLAEAAVSGEWVLSVAAQTGIPSRALEAYANAALAQQAATPGCGLGWNVLAAIGEVESEHGTHGGATVGANGDIEGEILGPVLDGVDWPAVRDTDDGALDGDTTWDRAVGPLQFLPETWSIFALDGNGDGIADPDNIDDAARTAAGYLCARGDALTTFEGWRAAIIRYNPDEAYLLAVGAQAERYGAAAPSWPGAGGAVRSPWSASRQAW